MVMVAHSRRQPLPDISAETTGKLERLIIELVWRTALNFDRTATTRNVECRPRWRARPPFVHSEPRGEIITWHHVCPAHLLIRPRSSAADRDTRPRKNVARGSRQNSRQSRNRAAHKVSRRKQFPECDESITQLRTHIPPSLFPASKNSIELVRQFTSFQIRQISRQVKYSSRRLSTSQDTVYARWRSCFFSRRKRDAIARGVHADERHED